MVLELKKDTLDVQGTIKITGSKSESNRLLILQALYSGFEILNLSNSHDSQVMSAALTSSEKEIDIHHAGTAMRFLTAYFAVQQDRETVLTGSARMQERPVGILVDALRTLGADITYLKNEGYAPLLIKGKKLEVDKVALQAHVSSQYISALMLIGATFPTGLTIALKGDITSVPYIKMTQHLLKRVGIESTFEDNYIHILPYKATAVDALTVESDWSSASYYYSLIALATVGSKVVLSSYKQDSLQGDSVAVEIYKKLGVETVFDKNQITLKKIKETKPSTLTCHLVNSPDIAQTIAVTCLGLGIGCELTGLHTLKIKETDRLLALKNEISKLGGAIEVTDDALYLKPSMVLKQNVTIKTYQDHRMAMAFAPLGIKIPIRFEDADVVEKSYPDFWKDFEHLGFKVHNV